MDSPRPVRRRRGRLERAIRRNRASVAAALIVAIATSGTASAAVTYLALASQNTAASTTTLSSSVNGGVLTLQNTNSSGGTSVRGLTVTVPSGRPPIYVNYSAGKATNLNADRLDGKDSTYFGVVRSFAESVCGACVGTKKAMASVGGLTLIRGSSLFDNVVHCQVYMTASVAGHIDGFVVGAANEALSDLTDTPVTEWAFGLAYANGTSTSGHVTFVNLSTNKAVTAQYSVYNLPDNGGCRWTGTIVSAP